MLNTLLFAVWFTVCNLAAQNENQEENSDEPKETVTIYGDNKLIITSTRTEEDPFQVPNTVQALNFYDLQKRKLSRTVPEALSETPGIMVQQTGYGQGSPFIRGFTGFRTLFLIDGIRLNNSVFREGPNQYWSTVDPFTIERLEVFKGPNSMLYGSDAVGGTVNAITRSREEYGKGFLSNGRTFYRFASAERSHIGRGEFSGALEQDFGFLVGTSLKNFGDLRGGESVGTQEKTGYEEFDGDLKFEYFLDPDAKFIFAYQQVYQPDVWRTHTTIFANGWHGTSIGSDLRRDLGQRRRLGYVQYHAENLDGFFSAFRASLSYQHQKEDQFRVRSSGAGDKQGFSVGTLGFWGQWESDTPFGYWTYGLDIYHDVVNSFRENFDATRVVTNTAIQGPVADDASYDLAGVFVQDRIALTDSLDIYVGGRFTYARVAADKVENPVSGNQIAISDRYKDLSGSLRAAYFPDEQGHWNVFAGVSQGFRAPNLSDLTRFDTARTNEIETPSPDLDPEEFITSEIGVKSEWQDFSSQVSYFYTWVDDMIIRTPTGNVISGSNEVTKVNAGDGFVHGAEIAASYGFAPQWSIFGNFTWMDGEIESFPTSAPVKVDEPLDRIQPPTANMGLHWEDLSQKYWIEGIWTVADEQDDLNASNVRDTSRIPPGGTPGYGIVTLRSGWEISKHVALTANIENLGNKDYRIHGSGINAPGRNIVVGVETRF